MRISSLLLGCLALASALFMTVIPSAAASGPFLTDDYAVVQAGEPIVFDSLMLMPTDDSAPLTVAVDNSIDPLCDGSDSGYNRPGGYCDQVKSNKSLVPTGSGWRPPCHLPKSS